MNIALVVVAYNRVASVERLLVSLSKANYESQDVDLVISIDKSKTDAVEKYADNYSWTFGNKIVVKHRENLGLRKHILSQGRLFDNYDALVILEDDIVVSPCFFSYVKQTVAKYSSDNRIAGISLYSYNMNYQKQMPFEPVKNEYDAYFMKCAMSWGQVWLKNQWLDFYAWYEENTEFKYSDDIPSSLFTWPASSWLKYHIRYCIEKNKYFVYPYVSLSTDFSDVGTHNFDADNPTVFQVALQRGEKKYFKLPDLAKDSVKYDGYYENEGLYDKLNLRPEECSIDINGGNMNKSHKRYWLTSSKLPYKIKASWGMHLRPAEINIFEEIPGEDIFLYDTEGQEFRIGGNGKIVLFNYRIQSVLAFMRIYGIKHFLKDSIKTIIHKITIKYNRMK